MRRLLDRYGKHHRWKQLQAQRKHRNEVPRHFDHTRDANAARSPDDNDRRPVRYHQLQEEQRHRDRAAPRLHVNRELSPNNELFHHRNHDALRQTRHWQDHDNFDRFGRDPYDSPTVRHTYDENHTYRTRDQRLQMYAGEPRNESAFSDRHRGFAHDGFARTNDSDRHRYRHDHDASGRHDSRSYDDWPDEYDYTGNEYQRREAAEWQNYDYYRDRDYADGRDRHGYYNYNYDTGNRGHPSDGYDYTNDHHERDSAYAEREYGDHLFYRHGQTSQTGAQHAPYYESGTRNDDAHFSTEYNDMNRLFSADAGRDSSANVSPISHAHQAYQHSESREDNHHRESTQLHQRPVVPISPSLAYDNRELPRAEKSKNALPQRSVQRLPQAREYQANRRTVLNRQPLVSPAALDPFQHQYPSPLVVLPPKTAAPPPQRPQPVCPQGDVRVESSRARTRQSNVRHGSNVSKVLFFLCCILCACRGRSFCTWFSHT